MSFQDKKMEQGLDPDAVMMRSRTPPLMKKVQVLSSSTTTTEKLSLANRARVWMINEGARRFFVIVFFLLHLMVFCFGFMNYRMKDNMGGPNSVFGLTYPIARAAALTLHVDIAFLLLPVCRTLISYARQSHLNGVIQFDKNITFHKLIGWSVMFFSWLHTCAHWVNLARFASANKLGFKGFLLANFATGPGWTGYVMLICLNAIALTSIGKFRRANFERFWYTHHLFMIFFLFWSFHGAFCMIKPDYPPYCAGIGVFWQYWILGGLLYLGERIAREARGKHKTAITKVVQHPCNVVEIQFQKDKTTMRAGQYVFICCPAVSIWQYHPFTLTSAPEEDFLSVHIRCVGDFTFALAKALGCNVVNKKLIAPEVDPQKETYTDVRTDIYSESQLSAKPVILPRLFIDGPFGSASEDVFKFETAVLVGAGIGVTPFASILKSIWYRLRYYPGKTRLRKVYFIWTSRDIQSFEWFWSLLEAIEMQDVKHQIELIIHTTAKADEGMLYSVAVHSESVRDPLTHLRTRTNFGRPMWDHVFTAVKQTHSPGEAGVFFCGPKGLGSVLHTHCNKHSDGKFSFVWGKENF